MRSRLNPKEVQHERISTSANRATAGACTPARACCRGDRRTGKASSVEVVRLIYFYLHFLYNGWFTFAVLGLLFWLLEKYKVSFNQNYSLLFFRLMFWPCLSMPTAQNQRSKTPSRLLPLQPWQVTGMCCLIMLFKRPGLAPTAAWPLVVPCSTSLPNG